MTHLAIKSFTACVIYGVMAICQTLNSRYLYRNLNFDFYSFVFGLQRIVIILAFYWQVKDKIRAGMFVKILPYSLFMCLNNILSSYCLTVMPLAAFLSFKKFIVLFILILTILFNQPRSTNTFQHICIIGIVTGGAMVGERDILNGNFLGYVSSLTYNLSESLSLIYASYLYRHDGIQPAELLIYNCMISLPYYLGVLAYQAEFDDVYYFLKDHSSIALVVVLFFSIALACASQFSASYIAMVISPFQKSIVSNIKDLILMIISVVYLHDYKITTISGLGIVLCLICSALFSLPYLEEKDQKDGVDAGGLGSEKDLLHPCQGTSLLEDRKYMLTHNSISEQITDAHVNPYAEPQPTPSTEPSTPKSTSLLTVLTDN